MFGNDKKKLEKRLEELESVSVFERGHKDNEEVYKLRSQLQKL